MQMFLKLTEADTGVEYYLNENHIIKIVPNSAGEGSLIYMTPATATASEPSIMLVSENADEIFRMISRINR